MSSSSLRARTSNHSPYWSDEVSSLGGLDSITTTKELSDHEWDTNKKHVRLVEPASRDKLVGRKNEVLLLRGAFQRISQKKACSEVALIDGSSGTGKTALAEAIRNQVTLKANGFYAAGKFDQIRNEPLSAIVEAFSDLCDLIGQEFSTNDMRTMFNDLDSDLAILTNILPNLGRMHGEVQEHTVAQQQPTEPESSFAVLESMSTSSGKDMFARFKLSCKRFLQSTASAKHPILLLLDDLQWADEASIEVIRSLMTDQDSRNVLLVCTYRSDGEGSLPASLLPLEEMLSASSDEDPSNHQTFDTNTHLLRVTRLSLADFDVAILNRMVATLLNLTESKTQPLSDLVHRRTHGNPYFVVEFLRSLESAGLLAFDNSMDVWRWELDRIQMETHVSDNVGELLLSRVQRLPSHVQSVLKVASCLGYKFDSTLLDNVLRNMSSFNETTNPTKVEEPVYSVKVEQVLGVAEEMGLVERFLHKTHVWSFSHDRVHQCLYESLPEHQEGEDQSQTRAAVHLSIAASLQELSTSTSEHRESLVCTIADQYNRVNRQVLASQGWTIVDVVAGTNLEAAKVTMSKSAIPVAAQYVRHCLSILEETREDGVLWDRNYDLALEIYTTSAQIFFCGGAFEECHGAVKEVEEHAKSSDDSLAAKSTLTSALGSKGRLVEAIELAFSLVREHGYHIPRRIGIRHIVAAMIKTKRQIRRMTDEELLDQRPNDRDRRLLPLLGQACEYASLAYKVKYVCMSVLTLMQIALENNTATAPTYAAYGILESVMGNYDEAYRFGQLAIGLQERQGLPGTQSRAYPLIYMFFHHWKHPLCEMFEPLHQSYELGMRSGEVEGAFMGAQTILVLSFHCGKPLEEVESLHRRYCQQMCDFDHRSKALLSLSTWQLCLNIMGLNDPSPNILDGEAICLCDFEKETKDSGNKMAQQCLVQCKLMLSYLLCDQVGLEQELERMALPNRGGSHFLVYCIGFHFALSLLEVNRVKPRRRYLKEIRAFHRSLKKNVRVGNANCIPLVHLMEAEMASQRSRAPVESVLLLYAKALDESSSQNLVHLQAIAYERAGLYLLRTNLLDEATKYLLTALDLFDQWGAAAKVEQMIAKHPLIFIPNEGEAGPTVTRLDAGGGPA